MSSIFSNTGANLAGPHTGTLQPAQSARQESFRIGNTTCLDLSRSAPMGAFMHQLDQCHPHLVRVIGSLPGKEVVSAVRHQLISAFQQVDVGGLLIGGSETIMANSNGQMIDSIPGLAVPLQSLAYTNSLHGDVLKVFGTLPTNRDSIITQDYLDVLGMRETSMHVRMQKELQRSLIFPTYKDNVWMGEAEGVVQAVESYLRHNPRAHYTVILAGGGVATEHEYLETQSVLASQFGDRVKILSLAESGGFSARLARNTHEDNVSLIDFSSRALSEKLNQVNRNIPASELYQEQMAQIEQQVRTIAESRVILSAGPNYSPESRSKLNQEISTALDLVRERTLLERLTRLADRTELKPEMDRAGEGVHAPGLEDFINLAGEFLHLRNGPLRSAQTPPRGQLAVAEILANSSVDISRQSALREPDILVDRDLKEKLFPIVDPIASCPAGNIIDVAGTRLVVALDEFGQRCLVGADGNVHPLQALDRPFLNTKETLNQQSLSNKTLSTAPETIPTWSSLEGQGGIVRYKDIHGNLLGHREILKVEQAKTEEGQIAKSVYRLITALDVTYDPPSTRLVRDIEHVNSLMFPPARLSAASFVEVFPFVEASRPAFALPQQHIDRSMPTRTASLFQPIQLLTSQIENALIQRGISECIDRIQDLSTQSSASAIACLTGKDPVFEMSLAQHREYASALKEFKELTATFLELISSRDPSLLERVSRSVELSSFLPGQIDARLRSLLLALGEIADDSQITQISDLYHSLGEWGEILVRALHLDPDRKAAQFYGNRYTSQSFSAEMAQECGKIAEQVTIDFASGRQEEFEKLRSAGGSTTLRFTSDYFLKSVRAGAHVIEIYDTNSEKCVGFNQYFPSDAISVAQKENNPILRNPGYGFYDLVCMRPGGGAPLTGSLMAIRAALVDLQYSDTTYLAATIHQQNEASMKSALRDRFAPAAALEARVFTKQVGNGFESRANTWKCPVSPAMRSALAPAMTESMRARKAVISQVQSEAGGFLNATQEERRQMQWIAHEHPDSAFIRMSVGVASMTDEAKANLQYLIDQGTFASSSAVFCLASGREASRSDAGWALMERGPHEIMQRLKGNLHPDSHVIGIGTTDSRDPNFGKSVDVLMSDGSHQSFPVAYTETDDGSKVTLLDRRDVPVLVSPITFPQDYRGNLSIFHLEQFRAEEFSEMFKSSAFLFMGGGGVNAWYIKELTEKIAQSPDSNKKVVLLKGFGGSTDKLADDIDWCSKYQSLIDQGRLVIIDPMESEEQRLNLQHLLEQTANEARAATN